MLVRRVAVFCAAALVLCGSGCAHGASSQAGRDEHTRGAMIYAKNCAVCHSAAGSRVGQPLEHVGRTLPLDRIAAVIEDPDPPMPKLYPSVLSRQDVEDVAAYVKTL